MDSNRLTTTNIGVDELKHLRKLAEKHGLKQVEFINHSISYFRKTGIDPSDSILNAREELEKISKRIDDVIRFIQSTEKTRLNPLMERLILLERHLSENYSNTNSTNNIDITAIEKAIQKSQASFGVELLKISLRVHRTPELIQEDIDTVYRTQKKTIAIIALLFECLKHSKSLDGLNEDYIKNFENAISEIRQF